MTSRKRTILIADDEEMVLDVAGAMLTHLGYDVVSAANGWMALEKYEQYRDRIDLVILDLSMPDMDGFSCLKKIREQSQVPVLVSSGLSHSIAADDPVLKLAQGILSKPFTLDNLEQIIQINLKD